MPPESDPGSSHPVRSHRDMLDMFLLSGKKTSHAVGGAYVELVKHMPHAFGMLYKSAWQFQAINTNHRSTMPMH